MKAPLSCSVFLFRQLCTRGEAPAKRPRNAPLQGTNLSAQLSLVNLFLCEIFPKPFIPSLSSGSWNAEKNTFFLFLFFFPPRMCLLCAGRSWAEEKRKQTCLPMHTHAGAMRAPPKARGCSGLVKGGTGLPGCQAMRVSAMGASGPQPGTGPEKHLTGCLHSNITV